VAAASCPEFIPPLQAAATCVNGSTSGGCTLTKKNMATWLRGYLATLLLLCKFDVRNPIGSSRRHGEDGEVINTAMKAIDSRPEQWSVESGG